MYKELSVVIQATVDGDTSSQRLYKQRLMEIQAAVNGDKSNG